MFEWLKKLFSPRVDSNIVIDDERITRTLGDGSAEELTWSDLAKISVITTNEGPLVEDAYLILSGDNGRGCAIPFGSPVVNQLLTRFEKLPGFDFEQFIAATSSTNNAEYVCWLKRPLQDQ